MLRLMLLPVTLFGLLTADSQWRASDAGSTRALRGKPQTSSAEPDSPEEVKAELIERIKSRDRFAQFADCLTLDLATQKVELRQACDRALYYCLAHYPDFLSQLQAIGRGNSLRLNLALHLVVFVQARASQDGAEPDMANSSQLEDELKAIFHGEQPDSSWDSFMARANAQGIHIR